MHYDSILVATMFFGYITWEFFTGVYQKGKRSTGDWVVDAISLLQLPFLKGAAVAMAFSLGVVLLPHAQNSLIDLPFWLGFLIVFLPDDFSHYWIHRLAHQWPWLWGAHRTHHATSVYQTSIAFRENFIWFLIMPGFWWAGLMTYLGLLEEVIFSTAIIGLHNVWLHKASTSDHWLYENQFTRRPMKILEYFINTPGLHRGHHGLGQNGVPMGNYGQTLFVWDVLFKTATFNKGALPDTYGTFTQETMQQPWYYHLWWPLFKKRPVNTAEAEVVE